MCLLDRANDTPLKLNADSKNQNGTPTMARKASRKASRSGTQYVAMVTELLRAYIKPWNLTVNDQTFLIQIG